MHLKMECGQVRSIVKCLIGDAATGLCVLRIAPCVTGSSKPGLSLTAKRRSRLPACLMGWEIGRAHVRTPVINAHLDCRLLLDTKKEHSVDPNDQHFDIHVHSHN